MSSDDYVTVTATIRAVRPRSIGFDRPGGAPGDEPFWMPRSLLHAASDTAVASFGAPGETLTLKVRRWKADELGLIEAKDPGQLDLLGGAASRRPAAR